MANATKMETLLVAPPLGTETNGNLYVLGDVAQKTILLLLLGEWGGPRLLFFFSSGLVRLHQSIRGLEGI